MALPNKRRGFRSIVVGDRRYRWHFSVRGTGFLTVVPESGTGQRLLVALPEWLDPWLHLGEVVGPLHNKPANITPAFVEQALRQALELGWRPDLKGRAFELIFADGRFRGEA